MGSQAGGLSKAHRRHFYVQRRAPDWSPKMVFSPGGEIDTLLAPHDLKDVLRRAARIIDEWSAARGPSNELFITRAELEVRVLRVAFDEYVAEISA
jgi:hypothetical protein